jgi:hypothetical protein
MRDELAGRGRVEDGSGRDLLAKLGCGDCKAASEVDGSKWPAIAALGVQRLTGLAIPFVLGTKRRRRTNTLTDTDENVRTLGGVGETIDWG